MPQQKKIPEPVQTRIKALFQQQAYQAAADYLNHLLNEEPPVTHRAAYLNFLGFARENLNQLTAAEDCYRQAHTLVPDHAEYVNNLAMSLFYQGKKEAAKTQFEQLLRLKPDADSFYNVSLAYAALHLFEEALDMLARAAHLDPTRRNIQNHLLLLLQEHMYSESTPLLLRQRVQEFADSPFYLTAMGLYFSLTNNDQMAVNYFKEALSHNKSYLRTFDYLIDIFQTHKHYAKALEWALLLYERDQGRDTVKTLLSSLQEAVPLSLENLERLQIELHHFLDKEISKPHPELALESVSFSRQINFYHSYQNQEDLPLQKKLSRFYRLGIPDLNAQLRPNSRRRVGIVSRHLRNHSVMHLLQRALIHVLQDPELETYLYAIHTSDFAEEDIPEELKAAANHFRILPFSYPLALQQLTNDNLDILMYTDVGMDIVTYELALQRTAKVQLTMSGHPVTTGMDTMDYFISSNVLETEKGPDYYSEQLITLAGLPDYEKPAPPQKQAPRQELGLPEGKLYFCPMTLFKIHPLFDQVVNGILEKDPAAQVLFLKNKADIHLALQKRFTQTVKDDHRIHFLNWSQRDIFYQRLQNVDVLLDSFYFGGGNTAYQALGLGCPIVTLDLPYNKSRWTQAMYKLMNIKGLVAASKEEYVSIAVRLANDTAWNKQLRQQIQQHNGILFDNPTWSEALLAFCKKVSLET